MILFDDEQAFNTELLDNLFKDDTLNVIENADELILIVDRSGSMRQILADAEGGVNSFIDGQKAEGEANLTIVEFDTRVEVAVNRINIKEAQPYSLQPRGMTSLYDAIGMTLANAENIDTTGKVIVAIVTDGAENSSEEYTQTAVFDRIKELEEKGWEFLFLSADQSAMQQGADLGIGKTIAYDANPVGAKGAYDTVAVYTSSLRGGMSDAEATVAMDSFIEQSDGVDR